MAYTWKKNPLFLSYHGVNVYHIFVHDFTGEGIREYCYGLTPYCSDEGGTKDNPTFSVCNLSTWKYGVNVLDAIKRAIDIGELTQKGIKRNKKENYNIVFRIAAEVEASSEAEAIKISKDEFLNIKKFDIKSIDINLIRADNKVIISPHNERIYE